MKNTQKMTRLGVWGFEGGLLIPAITIGPRLTILCLKRGLLIYETIHTNINKNLKLISECSQINHRFLLIHS